MYGKSMDSFAFWLRRGRRLALVPLLFCCLLLTACLESRLPEGVVATVNGEPIHLRAVQALLDSRSAALGTLQRPSLENMKRQYGEALGTLIIHALVRQELRRLQIPAGEAALDQTVEDLGKDYGGDALARFLADESMGEEDWRALMRDHLAMLNFETRVLVPGIRVDLPEVRAYYREHEADFRLPETLDVCFVTGEERAVVEAFCQGFPASAKEPENGALAQCLEVRSGEVPPPWQKEMPGLKAGSCGAIRGGNGSWQTVGLLERRPSRLLAIAEAYPLIERILLEQKKSAAFEQWLEGSLSRATVKVSPYLKEDLLTPPSARAAQSAPDLERDAGGGDLEDGQGAADPALEISPPDARRAFGAGDPAAQGAGR